MPHSDRHAAIGLLSDILTTLRKAVEQLPGLNAEERDTLIDILTANDLHTAAMATALKVLQRAVKDAAAWREVEAANTIIKALRATLRMVETGWAGVWFWQEDGRNDLPSLTCPVVLEADTMRKLMDQLHERSREAYLLRRAAATQHPACVCGKRVNDAHRLVAAYGAWCCPDRLSPAQQVTQVESPPEPTPLDRDAVLELANGRIEHQRQQMLELSRQLADKMREVQQLRDALQRFEDERFAVREVVGHDGDLKPAVLAYAERRVEEERDDFLRRVTMLSTAKVRG